MKKKPPIRIGEKPDKNSGRNYAYFHPEVGAGPVRPSTTFFFEHTLEDERVVSGRFSVDGDELTGVLGESLHTYLRYRWQRTWLHVAWCAFTLLCAFSLAALLSA